jgi:hypothetical protein
MTAVAVRAPKHRVHDALQHVPLLRGVDRMAHRHSPLRALTVDLDVMDEALAELTEAELIEDLEYYGPK